MQIRKILIIKLSHAEELILTTPVIRALKTQLDNVEVHYCTKQQHHALLSANPYVDRICLLKDSIMALIRQLKSEKYDAVVDLQHDLRSKFITSFLRTRIFRPDNLIHEIWMMVNLKINRLPNVHIVDRYMEAVKPLHVKTDKLGLDYFIPEKDEIEESWIPEAHHKEFVVFSIGARNFTKKLPLNKMIELCDKINRPVILLGGNEDHHTGEMIRAFFERRPENIEFESGLNKMNKKTQIFNACGKFNINQSASIVKRAKYVFTHDSLIMQIAAAYKKQIFSIWGNTIPLFGKYPYKTKFMVFENTKLNCRPCSKTGFKKCPKGHFKCMNDIAFDFYLP